MSLEILDKLRAAGRVAAGVRESVRQRARPGARLYELSIAIESEIERRGASPAFPAQCSCNHVAAHFCATPENDIPIQEGDLAKFDIGVHVDGWIVDTAVTVNVGDSPEGRALVAAAQAALDAGISAARPLGAVRVISTAIERAVRERGFEPLRELCGHGLARWQVHAPPPVPNVAECATGALIPGMIIAVETFASAGSGAVRPCGTAEVFRVDPQFEDADLDSEVLTLIRERHGLPFSRRLLMRFPRERVETVLEALSRRGCLLRYPPLVQSEARPVAQAEHTLYVDENSIEVLTL